MTAPLFHITRNDRGGSGPYTLRDRDGNSQCRITPAEADWLEPRLTATENEQRWTADYEGNGVVRFNLHGRSIGCLVNYAHAEEFADHVNRPTFTVAPTRPADDGKLERCLIAAETRDLDHLADMEAANVDPQSRRLKEIIDRRRAELLVLLRPADLPDGVRVADDGTLLAPGSVVRLLSPKHWTVIYNGSEFGSPYRDANNLLWFEVRRIPKPATERVPWHEALGRRSVHNGKTITTAEHNGDDVVLRCATTDPAWFPDADGTVEVLRDGEAG